MSIAHVTTAELPLDIFHGYAYMTADRYSLSDSGTPETSGWVDPRWSMTTLHDSRNDVRPAATWNRTQDIEDGEDVRTSFARWMRETLDEHFGAGMTDSEDGSGTYYGADETTEGDNVFTYALHFVATHHASRMPNIVEYRVSLAD